MPTVTKTWHFQSDLENWQVTYGGGAGLSSGWRSTDNAPGSTGGCLYVRRDGQNLADGYVQARVQISFAALGIPFGAIISRVSASAYVRCSDWNNGSTNTLANGPYFYLPRLNVFGNSATYTTYSGTTSWAQRLSLDSFEPLYRDEQPELILELMPRTANAPGAYVELRMDYVALSIDYVVPPPEPSASYSVVVGSQDISSYIEADSIRINRASNGSVSTARFRALAGVLADPLSATLAAGASISISAGSELLFYGEISAIDTSTQSRATRYEVTARGPEARLDRAAITGLSWSNTTVGAIASSLVLDYSAGSIEADASRISDARAVSSWSVQAGSVAQALRSLAEAYPAIWSVGPDRILRWRPASLPEPSGRIYGMSSAEVDSLTISEDMGRLANKVTVISSFDQITTTDWSANPASADDGYLSGSSSSWPPGSASSANTTGSTIEARAANTAPSAQTTISFAARARSGKTGGSWPPSTPFTPADNYISSIRWYPTGYDLQCQGFRINIPSGSNPIQQLEIILTVQNVADNASDNQNMIWVELTDQASYGAATDEPSSYYVGVTLTNGTHTFSIPPWYTWGDSVFVRTGIRYGVPAGLNQAEVTNCQLRITYQDLAASQYEESRALIRFDSSVLPDNADIISAQLKLYCTDARNAAWAQLAVSTVSPSIWPIDTSDWNAAATERATAGSVPVGWNTISLPASVINKTGYTALQLKIKTSAPPPSLSSAFARFSSADSASNKPILAVTYRTITAGVSATAQDAASQSQYGLRALMIAQPGISASECARLAAEELGKRAWPAKAVTLRARSGHQLMPGMSVKLELSPYLPDGLYVVVSVSLALRLRGISYEISCIGGRASLEKYLLEALR